MSDDLVRDLFEQAAEIAPWEREQFLASACNGDEELAREITELLAADAEAKDEQFWERSALHSLAAEVHADRSAGGQIVGNYRLVELIGRGGMGSVYRAVRMDAEFEKCVAVKLIDSEFYAPGLIANFRAERQILAGLEHPNIARLLDGGARADGMPYLIMEYVEGVSPCDYATQHNLSIAERLQLFRQICAAVHYAHQNMVIHRDLKPANILVTAQGQPKLLDFGIAKVLQPAAGNASAARQGEALTEPAMLRMTLRYSSPEQVRGEQVTTASDVYSLGVILYELLTGHSPYGDADRPPHQFMAAVCDEEPVKPSAWPGPWKRKLKGDLDKIILRALRKAPLERYASVDQFSEDILRFLEGRPVLAQGDAPLYLAAKFIRRNRVLVVAAALLLCSLVGGLIEVTLARARAERRFNQVRQLAHSVLFDYADAIDRLPGSTPVRAQLVKDALTYLDNLSKEADTPGLQREIVDAYVRVSNVQGNEYQNNLGDTAGAMASAHKAVDAAEKLLREDRKPPALASAADAFSTYGDLLYSTGDLPSVGTAYQRAIGLHEEIAAKSPHDLDNSIALSVCLRHMGDLTGGTGFPSLGRTADSLAYYQQGKELAARLVTQYPGTLSVAKESYKSLIAISGAEAALGRTDAATRDMANALAQVEAVRAAQPNDANAKVQLAIAEMRFGKLLFDGGNSVDAVAHITRSSEMLQALRDADPANALYRERQMAVEAEWGATLGSMGQFPAAIAHNLRAVDLAQSLSHDAPASVQYRSDLANSERVLSTTLSAGGDAQGALHHAGQAEQILCKSEPQANDAYTLANCGRAMLAAANAEIALHSLGAAIVDARQAEQIASARSQADPENAVFLSDWARSQATLAACLAGTGDNQDARGMYTSALRSWSILRQARSLTAGDSRRADDAAHAFSALTPRK